MKTRLITIMMLACLLIGLNQGVIATDEETQYVLSQTSDLQFTEETVSITVESGGNNTGVIRVHNYGNAIGSANISFAGLEPDGITVELSTIDIVDVAPGEFQDIIATVSAIADLWPLGPRRLDLQLVNLTTGFGFDDMALEMEVVTPPSTTTPPGIFGFPVETVILSVAGTLIVILIVIWLRRK